MLAPLRPVLDLAFDEELIDSISLDRVASPATIGSAVTVKADAARRLFEVDASAQTWAVLDTGINARHPAFWADPKGRSSRVVETFDLTRLDERDLELADAGPIDHLVEVVQGCAIPAWDGRPDSGYQEPIHRHGTHVAGVLAGSVPGRFEGVCPDMRLWDFRVLDEKAEGNEFRILLALRYIRVFNERERAIRVAGANMSLSLA